MSKLQGCRFVDLVARDHFREVQRQARLALTGLRSQLRLLGTKRRAVRIGVAAKGDLVGVVLEPDAKDVLELGGIFSSVSISELSRYTFFMAASQMISRKYG